MPGAGCPAVTDNPARIEPGMLAHLPVGVSSITLTAPGPCRFFVVGGAGDEVPPHDQPLAKRRTAEEIVTARDAWIAGGFGAVRGYAGNPLAAPPLPPGGLKAR